MFDNEEILYQEINFTVQKNFFKLQSIVILYKAKYITLKKRAEVKQWRIFNVYVRDVKFFI